MSDNGQTFQIPDIVVRQIGALHLQLAAAQEQIAAQQAELDTLRQQLVNGSAADAPTTEELTS